MTTIYFDTTDFFNSNNRPPKGFGNWAFRINGQVYFVSGKYAEAKKQAAQKAREAGASFVYVLA